MTAELSLDLDLDAPESDRARRAAALEKWRRRSRQVHFFRRALPAAIAAILVFGLIWVGVRAVLSAIARSERSLGSIHLLKPTFYGRNEKGELYIMSAAEAVRNGDDPDLISLTHPHLLQYPAGAPAPMTVDALHGLYHEATKQLELSGNVVATDGRGYSFHSNYAHVDMPKDAVAGNTHVFMDGPSGSISSDAYQIFDKGQHDIFTGNVHTHLTNKSVPKAPSAPPARPVLPAGALPIPFSIFGHGRLTPVAPPPRPVAASPPATAQKAPQP